MTTIEAKLSSIYRAAHVELPDQATNFATQAELLGGAIRPAAAAANEAAAIGLANNVTALGEELFIQLRRMAATMSDCAVGLERIANDFATTDAQAAAWLRNHKKWVDNHPGFGTRPETPTLPVLPGGRTPRVEVDPDLIKSLKDMDLPGGGP